MFPDLGLGLVRGVWQVINCPQGSYEWHMLRLGTVTGTGFKQVLNKGKGRKGYMDTLVEELSTGQPRENYVNEYMEHGTKWEPIARLVYEAITERTVQQVGFIVKDDFVGVSPDGLVGDDGIIEIKCPKDSTHEKYVEENRLPPTYKAQVQGLLWVTGREWVDFVSYHPRPIKDERIMIVRVERDEVYIKTIQSETNKFITEIKERLKHEEQK